MIPILETKRLFLKGVTLKDAPWYYQHFVDYDVVEKLNHRVPWPYPEGAVEKFLTDTLENEGKTEWLWGLFLKSNPEELIGAIHLFRSREENRGFWLGKKYWKQGLMTEAVTAVNDFAFDVLGFDQLNLANATSNAESRRVKEKTGAIFIGTGPARYVNPKYTEQEKWVLTKENWQKFKASIG